MQLSNMYTMTLILMMSIQYLLTSVRSVVLMRGKRMKDSIPIITLSIALHVTVSVKQ